MTIKPTYEELEQRVSELQNEAFENKRNKEALKKTQIEMSDILESISDGFFTLNDELIVTYFNKAAEQLLGRKSQEVIGQKLFDSFPEAIGSIFEDKYMWALKEKKFVSFQTYFGLKPYENWYDVRVYPFENGISVYFQVITEQKLAEDALRKSEDRYRSLVENQTELVSRFKRDGTFSYVNDAYCHFFGKARNGLIGEKWHPLPVKDDLVFIMKKLEALSPSNPTVTVENRVLSGKNDAHWMQFVNTGFFDEDGHLMEIQSVGRDVTDRRKAQEESARLALEWQNTFDATNDVVWILNRDQQILRSNKMAEMLFSRSREEMIGRHCWEIVHGTDEPIPECPGVRARKSLRREMMELQLGDGWFQVTVDPILDSRGNFVSAVHIVRDITEQKLVEIELQRTLEATTDGIWSWNFKTNQLFFSPKYYEMLGYAPNEFPADYDHWVNLIHPDDRAKALSKASEFLETKPDHYENEFRLKTRNGGYQWIRSQANVVERDQYGNAVYMIGNHEDITERREAENILRKSEERFRRVYQQSPISIEIYDSEGLLIEANPQCLKLFGINDLDKVKDFKLLDDPNLPHGAKEDLLRGIPVHYEHEFDFDLVKDKGLYETSRSGKAFISVHISPLFHPNNKFSGYLAQIEDITERKRAEEALRNSETYFREITENASDIVVIVDDKGIIGYTSPSVERFLGYRPEEFTGKSVFDFIHYDDIQRALTDFSEAIQTEDRAIPNSFRILHKNGSERVLEGLGKNLLHHPIITGFIMNIHDVTESRRLQSQLQHAQKIEAIATLTGGIAHDYNNLLSIILGNLDLASQEANPTSDQAIFLKEAEKAARMVRDLTHELMSLSRGGRPVREVGSIVELLKSVSELIPADSGISLSESISQDLKLVPYDRLKMGAVIKNVVKNAVEAMPDGGTLKIRAENLRVEDVKQDSGLALKPGDFVHISIQDQGKGIPEEHMDKIFDPYFSSKEMGVQKGMGLGLATAYAIINQHGGLIQIGSPPGAGTTVNIYLPAESGLEQIDSTTISTDNKTSSAKRVLVMDDEEMLRNLAEKMLEKLGYSTETVKDGFEAIEAYQKQKDSGEPFDAVILDLTIKGGMGGEQTIQELLKIDPDVKAIVSSGYFNDPVMSDFKKYGFVGALAKPYEKGALKEVIERLSE